MAGVPKSKTYMVKVASGRYGYAPTLAAAKALGLRLARLTERNDQKWNVSFVLVGIYKENGPRFYKDTGWDMAVPVRGTGARRASAMERIRSRYGVPPYQWFRLRRGG